MAVDDARRAEILDGSEPLDWSFWSRPIDESRSLTTEGKAVLHRAVDTIAAFLGESWLSGFGALDRPSGGVPLLSDLWWPINDSAHVHRRILVFAARLSVLSGLPGIAQVRRDMRSDLGHFAHGFLQLEVGGLARRAGWEVRLEPAPRLGQPGKVDLHLARGEDAMLVEVKGFGLDDRARANLEIARRVQDRLLFLSVEYDVHFEGDIDVGESSEVVDDWLLRVASEAARAANRREARSAGGPLAGRLRVLPGPPDDGSGWSLMVRRGDEWRRIRAALTKKAEQGRGDVPLWLRMDESAQFWALSAGHDEGLLWRRELCARIADVLGEFDHVAGVVLSAAPTSKVGVEQTELQLLGSRATNMIAPAHPPFARETLIIPNLRRSAQSQVGDWRNWYAEEFHWIDWALDVMGDPPLRSLLAEDGRR